MVLIRERKYVENARKWVERLHGFLLGEIRKRIGLEADAFDIEFRLVGIDATLGEI